MSVGYLYLALQLISAIGPHLVFHLPSEKCHISKITNAPGNRWGCIFLKTRKNQFPSVELCEEVVPERQEWAAEMEAKGAYSAWWVRSNPAVRKCRFTILLQVVWLELGGAAYRSIISISHKVPVVCLSVTFNIHLCLTWPRFAVYSFLHSNWGSHCAGASVWHGVQLSWTQQRVNICFQIGEHPERTRISSGLDLIYCQSKQDPTVLFFQWSVWQELPWDQCSWGLCRADPMQYTDTGEKQREGGKDEPEERNISHLKYSCLV